MARKSVRLDVVKEASASGEGTTEKEVIKVVPKEDIPVSEVKTLPTYWPLGINWETLDMEVLRSVVIKAIVNYAASIKREPTQEEYFRIVYRSIIKALAKEVKKTI